MSRGKKNNKRLIAVCVTCALVIAAVVGAGLFIKYRNDQKTVEVLPVQQVSEYWWGDQSSSSGVVMTDYVQEIYPAADKIVSEIYVQVGDEVRIGDPLLQYDKTKLELDLETKELAVKQADYSISVAQNQLKKLQNTKATSTPRPTAKPTATPRPTVRPTATPRPTPTPVPPASVTLYSRLDLTAVPHEGSGTSDDPYIFLCTDNCILTPEFLNHLFGNVAIEPTEEPSEEPSETPSEEPDDITSEPDGGEGDISSPEESATPTPTPTPVPGSQLKTPFAAVFEVREGNSNFGELISSFKLDGTDLSASFKNSPILNGYNTIDSIANALGATPTPAPTANSNNYNDMGYTASQLKELITEKKQEIQQLQISKKQAQLDLEKARLQVKNATVLSTVDGVVRSLTDEDSAAREGKPFLVVSGQSEYYVAGALSESMLGVITVGDEVTVNDYNTGGVYTAQIVSISDYPLDSDSNLYYYGSENPNSSRYEFTAVVMDAEEMQNGQYVDITFSTTGSSGDDALYIDNAYIREDAAGSYVMKAAGNNRLIKQYVQTGRSIYGSSTEIRSGLTLDDYIAFPYGTDVKEGVRVVLSGSSEPPYSEEEASVGFTVAQSSAPNEDGYTDESGEVYNDGGAEVLPGYVEDAEPVVIGGADVD